MIPESERMGCAPGKIINPLTNRCVNKTGRIGKLIVENMMTKERGNRSYNSQSHLTWVSNNAAKKIASRGYKRLNPSLEFPMLMTPQGIKSRAQRASWAKALERNGEKDKLALLRKEAERRKAKSSKTTMKNVPCKKSTEVRYQAKDGSWRCRRAATNTLRSLNWSPAGLPKKFGASKK
jgi:hypothetical protein